MTAFHNFAQAVQARFAALSQHELFVTNPDKDALWSAYLNAFPKGTNPIFRERTEHDCSCCRQFIKNLANVVALVDGKLLTLWDNPEAFEYPYDVVATALREFTRGHPINGLFRAELPQYGAVSNIERLEDGSTREWKHLHGNVLRRHQAVSDSAAQQGQYATSVAMFKRALGMPNEAGEAQQGIRIDAITTVLDLIDSNSLYRGAEFRASVQQFFDLGKQMAFLKPGQETDAFVWATSSNPVVRIRNTSIGTLLTDLSEGVDLQTAVASFEKKVAPENYKRPTALITSRMIEDALKTVNELGLRDALDRRFAKLSDVSVNDVLWVDNAARTQMKDSLASALLAAAVPAVGPVDKQAIRIDIERFLTDVLPQASEIKALVRNIHQGNLMTLTAPVHADSGQLFKWGNDFAWMYRGNLTDSIKEKVKRAGGNTNAPLRISLAWFNSDDLDIHVFEPNGNRIYFGNPCGKLDVDMNRAAVGPNNNAIDPVENVSFTLPSDGVYRVAVNNYSKRGTSNPGFVIELESHGQVQQFSYAKALRGSETVVVGSFNVAGGKIGKVEFKDLTGGSQPTQVWGITTENFVPVSSVMLSPNHWHGQAVGNKHYLFTLDGCLSDEPTRGIANEYLVPALDKHRKVFEVLGAKTMCPVVPEQLSGLGFSSTKRDTLTVQVATGNQRKTYEITFGGEA